MKKDVFWKIISFVFNPLLVPMWCVVLYYLLTPRVFFPVEPLYTGLVVATATIVIPLPVLFLLKATGKIESMSLHQVYERRLPLLLLCILLVCAVKFYLLGRVTPAMTITMAAAALSILIAYLSLNLDKISLHAMGMGGLFCFIGMMMVHWQAPLGYAVPVLVALAVAFDLVVMARMEMNRHNVRQLVLGTLVGALPQLAGFLFVYSPAVV